MDWKLSIINLLCVLSNVISDPVILSPCPKEEPTCLTQLIRVLYKAIVNGNEALSIPPTDPLYQEQIEGNLPTAKYKITKSTLIGFSQCEIKTVRITEDRNGTIFEMFCPNFKMTGHYVLDGVILVLPIKGYGELSSNADDYYFTIKADIKLINSNNGRRFMSFNDLEIDADLKGGFDLDLTNLYDGDIKAAETANYFIKDNWKQVADFLEGPIVKSSFKKLFTNLNRIVKTVPIDNIYEPLITEIE